MSKGQIMQYFLIICFLYFLNTFNISVASENDWQLMDQFTKATFNDIWGSSDNTLFVVGNEGTIFFYNRKEWSEMASNTEENLNAVWGVNENEVFAVGDSGTILYYNGISWVNMVSGTYNWLQGIWGRSNNDVYAVGGAGTILHYDGNKWQEMSNITFNGLNDLYGNSENIVAVGNSGTILIYKNNQWKELESPTFYDLNSIWGYNNNYFAVGFAGTVVHYNGSSLQKISNNFLKTFNDIWGTSENNILIVGNSGIAFHFNIENIWTQLSSNISDQFNAIWGNSNYKMFTVSSSGKILYHMPSLNISVVEYANEGDKSLVEKGIVSLEYSTDKDMIVNLHSNNINEVLLPHEVTIGEGEVSKRFDITIIDDLVIDGTKTVTLSASAANWITDYCSIDVIDNDNKLNISAPKTVVEDQGTMSGTISISVTTASDLDVNLLSYDKDALNIPPTVKILPGHNSVSFTISIIDNLIIEDSKMVYIEASRDNWQSGVFSVNILDNDKQFIVELPEKVTVNDEKALRTGIIKISDFYTSDLLISLSSDNPNALTVPSSVVLYSNYTSAEFDLAITNRTDISYPQTIQVEASKEGWKSGNATTTIIETTSSDENISKDNQSGGGCFIYTILN